MTLEDQAEIHESRADFLSSRALLARGQTTRGIRFSESSIVELDSLGSSDDGCHHAVKFVTNKGKMNKYRMTLMVGMLR